MYTVKKRSKEICIGHRLINYEGMCKNVHGHGIVIELTFQGSVLTHGMLVDFLEVADFLKDIDRMWDHGFLVNGMDLKMLNFLKSTGSKYYITPGNPTMETLAQEVWRLAKNMFSLNTGAWLANVTIYEKNGNDNGATYHD